MKVRSDQFRALAGRAVQDEVLHQNLLRSSRRFKELRQQALKQMADPEAARRQARTVKDQALSDLPRLLQTLERRVEEAGGVVHWARDGVEARSIISDLAREHNVRRIVKGKSMMTEEIGLNEELAAQNFEVWETDLGEFIVQLAGEGPSHIIAPAVHKNRQEIGRLFAEKLGVAYTEKPQELTLIARRVLRQKFLTADMGLTGVNAAVAETGTVVLFENEGNIRLTTTLPRIHVALMGLEKVVATWDDLKALISLLPQSASGQQIASYVTFITGPRKKGEPDGAEEFHLIILDNGRSDILADPERREILRCLRCGACLNVCPVYQHVGGFSYGWVYSGPLGAVLTPQLLEPGRAPDLPFASTLCGACAEVCPVMIDLPRQLLILRRLAIEDPRWPRRESLSQRLGLRLQAFLALRPRLFGAAAAGARLARRLGPAGFRPFSRPSGKGGK